MSDLFLIGICIVALVFVANTLMTMPAPDPTATLSEETWNAINEKSPEWGEALKHFVGIPTSKRLLDSLLYAMLMDVHGSKQQ